MRFWTVLILLFALQRAALSGYDINRFEAAKKAHLEKRFVDAISFLEQEMETQTNNPSVYFNLGLAYKAEERFPEAIWAFEKTLKLQPKDADAIELIESCYIEMDDSKTWESETGTFQRALIALGSNFWSGLSILLSFTAGIAIILSKRSKSSNKKKWLLGSAFFSIITLFICLANASSAYEYEHSHNYAIVLEDFEISSSSLSEKEPQINVPAGTKVRLLKWNKDGSATVQINQQEVKVPKGLARI